MNDANSTCRRPWCSFLATHGPEALAGLASLTGFVDAALGQAP
ncbi:MAG: hypothetical protein ABI323_03435 [Solirubrobacteraceae bacterium]